MHPIEHLRYIARSHGVDPAALVDEMAYAFGSLPDDPAGLVVASRRIVERHPFVGPVWWMCSKVATAPEPDDVVWDLAAEMRADPTARELAAGLADDAVVVTIGDPSVIASGLGRRGDIRVLALDVEHSATGFVRRLERHDVDYEPVEAGLAGAAVHAADVVLVEALALDESRVVVASGASTIAAPGRLWDVPVWLVAGLGRRLPAAYLDAMVGRLAELSDGRDPWDVGIEVVPTSVFDSVVGPNGVMPMGPPATRAECSVAGELLRTSPM